jgi:Ca2+-binding EF-hand superfamily protein
MRTRYGFLLVVVVLAVGLAGGLALAQTPIAGQADWRARFQAHDWNKDGRVDRAEFQEWMTEVFYIRDKDRKGYLVIEDVRDQMQSEVFKAVNRKGDGKLVLREFLNALFVDFDAADVERNGALTVEEIEAYIRRPAK